MKTWARRIRGALGMTLMWGAAGWLLGIGLEVVANLWPGGISLLSVVDIWPAALGLLGGVGGAAFATVLSVVGSRGELSTLSLPRFAALGALGGLLLGATGLAVSAPLRTWAPIVVAVGALGTAIGAATTFLLARGEWHTPAIGPGAATSSDDSVGPHRACLRRRDGPQPPGGSTRKPRRTRDVRS